MTGLVRRTESKRYPGLFVKKYAKKVFYDNLWDTDPTLIESRGHVETADGKVVVRPFTKIFNRFENNTDIDPTELCVSVRKVNGFMAAVTWVNEVADVVVSTSGSLDSDFVALAGTHITPDVKSYIKLMMRHQPGTFMFEVCDRTDPHIVPEDEGAYLIGYRAHDDDGPYFSTPALESVLDSTAKAMGVLRPSWDVTQFSTVVNDAAACKHEGFVVYGQTSKTALKIKSPYYLILKACARKKDILLLDKRRVDEEYYPLIDHLMELGDAFNSMDEQARLAYVAAFLDMRCR